MKNLQDLKIIFLGTPGFAVASLDALVQAGVHVIAVVTAPDKPSGRGLQMQSSEVKKYAEANNIRVLQPAKLKDPAFTEELRALQADLQIVVAFRMLPEAVWNMPPMGTVNVHASLLPQYRGAAPVNWAVINGEKETGVTTFRLKHEIDTGDILLQEKIDILPEDNAGSVHDKLMQAGAKLLVKTVKGLVEGRIEETPQPVAVAGLKHAPKIFKEDTRIDWNRSSQDVNNFIRGLSPYPVAFTVLKDRQLKIYQSHAEQGITDSEPGICDTDHKSYLRFAAKDGWVYVEELQLEGKKRMKVAAFLKGFR